jgi:hypothetical protein
LAVGDRQRKVSVGEGGVWLRALWLRPVGSMRSSPTAMVFSIAVSDNGGSPVRAYSPNDGLTPSGPAAEAAVGEGQMVAALRRLGVSEGCRPRVVRVGAAQSRSPVGACWAKAGFRAKAI